MKLLDLKPQWVGGRRGPHGYLEFECPKQHVHKDGEMKCAIVLPILPEENGWTATGDSFETMTIAPSIWHHCEEDPHFWIRNGEIVFA